jgi:2',3'-cyclic-nucleotide 2'-phosphodiesterase (5'-nucleotidase family)
LKKTRPDSIANLTVEAGNFAPPPHSQGDKAKTKAFLDFYRVDRYDAITLSSSETSLGMKLWTESKQQGFPIVVANLFTDAKGKKPVFEQFLIKKDHDYRLGVIGFISQVAWANLKDSTCTLTYKSPFEFKKLIHKVAKKTDHLTVLGEFSKAVAESLIHAFPEIDLVVTSANDNNGQSIPVGKSVIVGAQSKGYYGSYVDWNFSRPDTANPFILTTAALDGTHGVDTLVTNLISAANELIKAKKNP